MADEQTPGKPNPPGRGDPEPRDPNTRPSSRQLRPAGSPGPLPRVANIDIPVVGTKQNTEVIVVTIIHDRLVGHIESFARGHLTRLRIRQLWLEALSVFGIALALVIPLVTSTFKKFGPFSPRALEDTCGFGAALATLATIIFIFRALKLLFRHHRSSDYKGVGELVKAIEESRQIPTSS